MAARSLSTYGLEIGKSALGVAQYFPEGGYVANVAVELLEDHASSWWPQVEEKFKGLVATMKLGGQDAVCSVPAEAAVVKRLLLDKDELLPAEAIQWEVAQHIMGSMDDYLIDFEKEQKNSDIEAVRYLVVACRHASVKRIQSLLLGHKVVPTIVDIDLFALVNVFEANYPEHRDEPSFLVLGSDDYTKVILTMQGGFIDHEYFVNNDKTADPQTYADAVKAACNRLRLANSAVLTSGSVSLFASGAAFSDEAFADRCFKEMGRAELLNPFRKIDCKTALPPETIKKFSPHLSVAVGLALRGSV